MRAFAVIVVAAIVLGGAAGASAAKRHEHHRGHHHAKRHETRQQQQPQPMPPRASRPASFDGSCDFSGAVRFTPPMTATPQHVAQHGDAPGTCSGTFVDHGGATHALDNAKVQYRAESSGDTISCEFGVASGTGTLAFPDGDLTFAMAEYRPVATPILRLTGTAGGGAWMAVTPAASSDPAAAVEACNGAGLTEFDLNAHLQTDSPMLG